MAGGGCTRGSRSMESYKHLRTRESSSCSSLKVTRPITQTGMFRIAFLLFCCLVCLPGCIYLTAANLGMSAISTLTSPGEAVPVPDPGEQAAAMDAYQQCMERSQNDPYTSCSKELAQVLQSNQSSGYSGYRIQDSSESVAEEEDD